MVDAAWLSIAEIAQAYATRALSPVEFVTALFVRIDRLEPQLHCFISLDREAILDEARAAETSNAVSGPLWGVPVGIKDLIDVAGQPTSCHSRLREGHLARHDAAVVTRLRNAGAIIFGKLATHEFAIGGPSFDLPFPPARNPWNTDHHPGGSSSGAGAAVAAGLLPGAIGTDTAGSIRNPASACGIVGLKPTAGFVPTDGVFPLAWSLDHVGPLGRSVADVSLLLDALTESSSGCDLTRGVRGLRIGMVRHFHETDMVATPDVAAAFENVAAALQHEGAILVPVVLPPLTEFDAINKIILKTEGFAIHGRWMRDQPEAYGARTRMALLPGAFISAETYIEAQRRRRQMTAEVEAVFQEIDILLTASSLEPPCRIDDDAEITRTYMLQARSVFNNTGHPALAMMAGLSSNGLPLSVQFAARYHDERTLFRAAAAWERAMGGPQRSPIASACVNLDLA